MNYLAILVSGVISMAVGAFWYSPAVFGRAWMKLSCFSNKQIAKAKNKGMGSSYFAAFIAALVTSWIFAQIVELTGATTAIAGALVGFAVWLGFFATTLLSSVLWEQKPVKLYLINIGHYLVVLLITGALLAV
ncbi:MAG: DUF1761 domain-containing protein [Candidatus Woesearchaeota archaeon]|nr:DUF1761 domain-containing protein [Candidatus Woesearchaeota archaeon]